MIDPPTNKTLSEDHVREMLSAHKAWMDSSGGRGRQLVRDSLDLTGFNFAGLDLSDSVLYKVNLSGSNLTGVSLKGATLIDCDFTNCSMEGCDLSGADLRMSDFSHAYMQRVVMNGANPRSSRFFNTDLSGSQVRNLIGGLPQMKHCLTEALDKVKENMPWIVEGTSVHRTWGRRYRQLRKITSPSIAVLGSAELGGVDFTGSDLRLALAGPKELRTRESMILEGAMVDKWTVTNRLTHFNYVGSLVLASRNLVLGA